MKKTTLPSRHSISCTPYRLALLLIPLAVACFALVPQARAVCQQGCDFTNTFLGEDALLNNTSLLNTAIGGGALYSNTGGFANTAVGLDALFNNVGGTNNTAIGVDALLANTDGNSNTAIGLMALSSNKADANTASGASALFSNTTGTANTATGVDALEANTTGSNNTANGVNALHSNGTGSNNTAVGVNALLNNGGSNNLALGFEAGINLSTGSNNIHIGNAGGGGGESNRIRIGTVGMQTATFIAGISGATVPGGVGVIVGTNGKLGTVVSSARFKDAVKPMDNASDAILALKPVTFRYKKELDPDDIPQFGLVAEDVEKVNPDLVARDEEGKPYTVRYEAVNAMLLNEFLKEHRKVEELEATVAELRSTAVKQQVINAQQQKGMEVLTAQLKEQAARIEKVSTQLAAASPSRGGLEARKLMPQLVVNDR